MKDSWTDLRKKKKPTYYQHKSMCSTEEGMSLPEINSPGYFQARGKKDIWTHWKANHLLNRFHLFIAVKHQCQNQLSGNSSLDVWLLYITDVWKSQLGKYQKTFTSSDIFTLYKTLGWLHLTLTALFRFADQGNLKTRRKRKHFYFGHVVCHSDGKTSGPWCLDH